MDKKRHRGFFSRELSFTREGRVFVFITVAVGFAAVNTGNNLLFLVLGMMLGLIGVSGVLSEITLRRIQIRRNLQTRAEANVIFPVEFALKNTKTRAASFCLELRDYIESTPFKRRCFFLRVGPNEERSISYRCEIGHRGHVRFDGISVSTKFPFGFFEKTYFIPLDDELLVWPARVPVQLPEGTGVKEEGLVSVNRRGMGQDFWQLRPFVEGDEYRRIHWPTSARTGVMMVREMQAESNRQVEIVLDAALNQSVSAEQVEHHISMAASFIHLLAHQGVWIRLVTNGAQVFQSRGDRGDVSHLLDHLARLEPSQLTRLSPPVATQLGAFLIGPSALGDGIRVHGKGGGLL